MLVSAAVASSGAIRRIADAWLLDRAFSVATSEGVLEEVERALTRPYFARRIAAEAGAAYVDLVRREAILVEPRTTVRGIARDPADDAVLAAAVDAAATYLVTGDAAMRRVDVFRGVKVVRPHELIEILELP